jgi:hypothetical protein
MVFNTTFNNISVLLVEETGVPGENHDLDTTLCDEVICDKVVVFSRYSSFLHQ